MRLRGPAAIVTIVVALGACSGSSSKQVKVDPTTTTATAIGGTSLALVPAWERTDFQFDSFTQTAASFTLHYKNDDHIGFLDIAVTYGPKPTAVVSGHASDEVIADVKRSLVPVSRADALTLLQASPTNPGVEVDTHTIASLNGGPGIETGLRGTVAGVGYEIKVGSGSDGFSIGHTPDNAFVRRGPGGRLVLVYLVTSPGVTKVSISADGHAVATGAPVPAPGAPGWFLAVAGIDKGAKRVDLVPTSTGGNHPAFPVGVAASLSD